MIGAVARAPVPVPPAVVAREELLERGQQVLVRARAELHDHHAGRGVRHEDGEEPIGVAGDVRQERAALIRNVGDRRATPGLDGQLAALHYGAA